MGTQGGTIFAIWLLFAVPGGFGGQSDSQGLPQEPPGPVQASIFIDFGPILDLFLIIVHIMRATFGLVCLVIFWVAQLVLLGYFEPYFSNFYH